MVRLVKIWLALSLLLGASLSSFSAIHDTGGSNTSSSLKITVRLYIEAPVSLRTINQAKKLTTHIFQKVGVDILWLDCRISPAQLSPDPACRHLLGPAEIVLTVSPQAAHLGLRGGACGFAYQSEEVEFNKYAEVYYDCVEKVAHGGTIAPHQILGYVIAHEIGHLLLNDRDHSFLGIMRASWNRQDLEDAARGVLSFTKLEAHSIQANAIARIGR